MKKKLMIGLLLMASLMGILSGCLMASNAQGITINKEEVSQRGYKIYKHSSGEEVIAYKNSKDEIKTVFNTCQVCYNSGKGYYKINGNRLICQNCKATYSFDEITDSLSGCNPVSILKNNWEEDEINIYISDQAIFDISEEFKNW